ncbi:unnamed protein product [Acanthoscelides obtectus]|uniref:Uncharacterized protein n=1 Tax=Acanthoscelides obtectus TaxID=200917 RepID=A0A9P0LQG2_ACAOB|nr:unnamed protein product [Acanthoscelides obtectus]CAK1656336.1 hypothetical protein AOBTE_LOCUS19652 [Acanthoscelides obtectus]
MLICMDRILCRTSDNFAIFCPHSFGLQSFAGPTLLINAHAANIHPLSNLNLSRNLTLLQHWNVFHSHLVQQIVKSPAIKKRTMV